MNTILPRPFGPTCCHFLMQRFLHYCFAALMVYDQSLEQNANDAISSHIVSALLSRQHMHTFDRHPSKNGTPLPLLHGMCSCLRRFVSHPGLTLFGYGLHRLLEFLFLFFIFFFFVFRPNALQCLYSNGRIGGGFHSSFRITLFHYCFNSCVPRISGVRMRHPACPMARHSLHLYVTPYFGTSTFVTHMARCVYASSTCASTSAWTASSIHRNIWPTTV